MPVVDVLDSTISYLDRGSGTPVVFLHGNPTSSHVWRKVLARFGRPGRVLVPDLIGMGRSGKPDIDYSFDDHARYLDAWFDALGLDRVVLVGHDWGGALAFDRAARHPDRVLGIAFLEAVVAPMSWAEFPPAAHERFTALRTPGVGEELALDRNVFIEDALTRTMLTPLSAADHDVYRSHYPTRASRAPLLAWSRSMPIGGEPADVVARVEAYDRWLAASPEVPKLLLSFGDHPTLMIDRPGWRGAASTSPGWRSWTAARPRTTPRRTARTRSPRPCSPGPTGTGCWAPLAPAGPGRSTGWTGSPCRTRRSRSSWTGSTAPTATWPDCRASGTTCCWRAPPRPGAPRWRPWSPGPTGRPTTPLWR
jgi:haloalkane dehalogenase